MNKKALAGLAIAVLLPVVCYLILKYTSDEAVHIPRHFLMDTVVNRIDKGKTISDTIWHTTANIRLQNQLGDTVNLYDIKGKIIVADFFFTHCGSICPRLTANMARLQRSFLKGGDPNHKVDTSIVQFLSFSIDPDHDSASVLKAYADKFGADHDNWWFLTGPRDSIYRFAFEELKVDKFSQEPVTPDFIHTSRFVLLDKKYQVRGWYNGLDSVSLGQLAKDIGVLMLEKDKTARSEVFTEIVDLSWLWLLVVVLVIIFVLYMRGRRKKNG